MRTDLGFVRSLTTGVPPVPLEEIVIRPRWQRRAVCRDSSPETFYASPMSAEAAEMCARCPVRLQCLRWAVRRGEVGTWAGTTETERRAMRAQWRQARADEGEPVPRRGPPALPSLGARRAR